MATPDWGCPRGPTTDYAVMENRFLGRGPLLGTLRVLAALSQCNVPSAHRKVAVSIQKIPFEQ